MTSQSEPSRTDTMRNFRNNERRTGKSYGIYKNCPQVYIYSICKNSRSLPGWFTKMPTYEDELQKNEQIVPIDVSANYSQKS